MRNGKFALKFEVYIAAPGSAVWEALTNGSATKWYFYGCSIQSTFKKGASISCLGDGEFNMVDGEIVEVKPQERLVTTFQAHWDEKVSKEKPSRVAWVLTPRGESSKVTLVHDRFDSETATYKQST
jgi:uncharacterized protein YndB with AHSA1/START domain